MTSSFATGRLRQVVEDGRLIGQPGAGGPVDPDRPRRLDRRPFVARDDGEEITLAHGLHESVHLACRRVVDGRDAGAVIVGPDHARMQHAGQADVVDIGELAGDLAGDVHARDRLADHLVLGRSS